MILRPVDARGSFATWSSAVGYRSFPGLANATGKRKEEMNSTTRQLPACSVSRLVNGSASSDSCWVAVEKIGRRHSMNSDSPFASSPGQDSHAPLFQTRRTDSNTKYHTTPDDPQWSLLYDVLLLQFRGFCEGILLLRFVFSRVFWLASSDFDQD
jgi:hypothetical protein